MIRMRMLATVFLAAALSLAAQPKYEMTTHYVVFLKKGPKWTPGSSPELQKLQAAHLGHLTRMAESGKMLLAGPFADSGELRGMCVYRVDSEAEARSLAESDPAVQAGRLAVEVHPWMSAKGIQTPPPSK